MPVLSLQSRRENWAYHEDSKHYNAVKSSKCENTFTLAQLAVYIQRLSQVARCAALKCSCANGYPIYTENTPIPLMRDIILVQTVPLTFGISQIFDKEFDSGWVQFPGHYLLYASTGAFHLEVGNTRWLLPPQRAAWVAAHTPIHLYADGPGTTSSVLFTEQLIPRPDFLCRVFAVSALAREMLLYAMQWGAERDPAPAHPVNQTADRFFQALAAVCAELAAQPDEFWLPQAQSAELAAALAYTLAHLADPLTVPDVAQAVSVSERTLARRFAEEIGMTWRQYIRRARMIHAMELLADEGHKVIDIAYAVGFASISAFNYAFREFIGETPSSYRKRFVMRKT